MTVRWVLSGLLLALVMSSAPLTALPGPLAQSSSALASVSQTRGNEPASSAKIAANLAKTPLMFIENVGQFDQGARFRIQGADANLLLDDDALWYSVMEKPAPAAFGPKVGPQSDPLADTKQAPRKGVNLKVGFVGANPHPRIEPFNRLETHVSYFIGNDSSRWKSDVPVWGGVRYVDIYPGIDLEVTSENGHLVQRMVTKRKANLEAVRLRVEGADSLEVKEGRVQVKTAIGTLDVPGLKVQGTDGSIAAQAAKGPEVNGNVVIRPFSTSQPDSGLSAFSATDLLYSTFLGGSGYHYGYGIVVDSSGAAYVTGFTTSPWDPTTPGAFDPTWNGESDAFVTKLNPSGTQPVYSTYLGGGYWDEGRGIAVDSSGAAYVTGGTGSSDFPTTPAAFDTTINDSHSDGFVTKLQMLGPAVVDLPVILDSAYGGWTTGISIRNTSAGVANVQVLYYNSTGANVLTDNANIPANGFWGNYQGGRFGGNWAGSATILSTKPVTAIVNEVGPDNYAMGYTGAITSATTIYLPAVMDNAYGGWTSGIGIKNTSNIAAAVTIWYYRPDGVQADSESQTIQPNGYWGVYQGGKFGGDWAGSAVITSNQPVVAVVNEVHSSGSAISYNGFPAGGNLVNLPTVLNNAYGGWTTGVSIQNTSTSPGSGTITYYNANGIQAGEQSISLPGKGYAGLYQGAAGLPDDWAGSAVISTTTAVVAIVNEVANSGDAMGYGGVVTGVGEVNLPAVMDNAYGGWTTGMGIRNTSGSAVHVDITFYDAGGTNIAFDDQTIPGHGYWGLYQGGALGGQAGSARIVSSGPVAVIVNEVGPGGSAISYNGTP